MNYAVPSPELMMKVRRARAAVASQKQRKIRCPYCHHNSMAVHQPAGERETQLPGITYSG